MLVLLSCPSFYIWILQISWNQKIYLRSHFFVTLFNDVLSKTTKLNLLVSNHEEVSINFNFIICCSLSLCIYIYLSLSLSFSLPLSLSFLFLSPKFPLLLHLMQIYERFRLCSLLRLCVFNVYNTTKTSTTNSIVISLLNNPTWKFGRGVAYKQKNRNGFKFGCCIFLYKAKSEMKKAFSWWSLTWVVRVPHCPMGDSCTLNLLLSLFCFIPNLLPLLLLLS